MIANEAVKVSRLQPLRGIPPPEKARLCVRRIKKYFGRRWKRGKTIT